MKPTFEFTIDRSKWACKTNNLKRGLDSMLLTDDGFRCCLGFLASVCGEPDERLHQALPDEDQVPAGLTYGNQGTPGWQAVDINDSERNNAKRERRLRALFAKAGIRVHFVGEYL